MMRGLFFRCLPLAAVLLATGGEQVRAAGLPLTLTLVMEQSTCDLSLKTPATLTFPGVGVAMLGPQAGHVTYAGEKNVTLNLANCAGSARDGAMPAVQISGNNPLSGNSTLFRDYTSAAEGGVGFGLRQVLAGGQPGAYLASGSYVDAATATGLDAQDQDMHFLVDMLYDPAGGQVTSGMLQANIRFQFAYH
ncbi:hypothetical protein BL250_09200 [Erwinia sp. OLTSP20]|uniref:fimbrial protein n=1 Tax=unclassified Erwinia TaxID=2622719 RepID=UPI000C19A77A|nr:MULTISPECIES: fimbrial protein [unclassified Erwinia]PIJ50707.1 hypothetical protein BV501_06875 [Erwinia sp. OAMSP11]PIJ75377.1 hypothetical protein BK416_01675 [Erwinia sp. OLSSP12]PIJ81875.1 hypothetical protein BLD47_07225 [Erwinia sp. OLCASP19]PIJ84530.1 hypothetical protein BLD46_07315 [Erwinia sp. OLMTSP26]PIJ86877.1 hypothetical protein BLD49_07085 [Erwinia sp. OLMDSP33]